MTTTVEQVQRVATTLDQDVSNASRRVDEADEKLRLAQAECEAARAAFIEAQQKRDAFQESLAQLVDTAMPVAEPTGTPRTGRLVLANRRTKPTSRLAGMSIAERLKHVLGDRTRTLDEIRAELKAAKASVPQLSAALSRARHNVLDADGQPMRDDNGKLLKQASFISPSRGEWRVAQPEDAPESAVLTRTQAQVEMLMNSRSLIRAHS